MNLLIYKTISGEIKTATKDRLTLRDRLLVLDWQGVALARVKEAQGKTPADED